MVWYHKFAFARNHRNYVEDREATNKNIINEDKEIDDNMESDEEMETGEADSLHIEHGLKQDEIETRRDDSSRSKARYIQPLSAISVDTSTSAFTNILPAEMTTQSIRYPLQVMPSSPTALVDLDQIIESATFCPLILPPAYLQKSVSTTLSLGSPMLDTITSPVKALYSPQLDVSPSFTSEDDSQFLTASTSAISSIYSASASNSLHRGAFKSVSPILSPAHSPFLRASSSRPQYGQSPCQATSASLLPSMPSPLLKTSASTEQSRHPLLLATLARDISSVNLLHLEAPASVEQYRLSPSLKPVLSSESLRFSPISALSQNNSRTEADASSFITAFGDNEEYALPKLNNRQMGVSETSILRAGDILHCEWVNCFTGFSCMQKFIDHVNGHVRRLGKPEAGYHCKWLGCTRNGKGFDARYKLLVHLRTHTSEKPYQCSTCGKHFSRKDNMKIHVRSHTGERPCICPHEGCNKAFSNSSDRLKHFRTHKEDRPYACKIPGCKKSYTDPSSLRKHLNSQLHCSNK